VAYSGTYVVGHAILGWYLSGRHLSSKQMRDLSVQAFSRGKDYARKLVDKLPKRKPGKRDQEMLPAGQKKQRLLPEFIVIKKKGGTPQVEIIPENSNGPLLTASETSTWYDLPAVKRPARKPRLIRPKRINRHEAENTSAISNEQVCGQCGRSSSSEARFCQYCGAAFDSE
jgi:hypothetical protein